MILVQIFGTKSDSKYELILELLGILLLNQIPSMHYRLPTSFCVVVQLVPI